MKNFTKLIIVMLLFLGSGNAMALEIQGKNILKNQLNEKIKESLSLSQKKEKSADERIADYTYYLMILTGVMALVAMVQIYFLNKSNKTAKISACAAKQSADSSILQIKMMAALEQPYIVLGIIGLEMSENGVSISANFINSGRSAANVKEVFVNHTVVAKLPKDPVYSKSLGYKKMPEYDGVIVGPNGGSFEINDHSPKGQITAEQIEAIKTEKEALWVYGYIKYSGFDGAVATLGFVKKWKEPRPGLAPQEAYGFVNVDAPPAYTYHRKEG